MGILEIIGSIMLVISSLILIAIVLAQHGKSAYLGGAIAGGAAETFMGKNKARNIDTILSKYTKIVAVAFIVLTVFVNIASIVIKH